MTPCFTFGSRPRSTGPNAKRQLRAGSDPGPKAGCGGRTTLAPRVPWTKWRPLLQLGLPSPPQARRPARLPWWGPPWLTPDPAQEDQPLCQKRVSPPKGKLQPRHLPCDYSFQKFEWLTYNFSEAPQCAFFNSGSASINRNHGAGFDDWICPFSFFVPKTKAIRNLELIKIRPTKKIRPA